MPCKIWLRQDDSAVYCAEAADVVVKRVEESEPGRFIPVTLIPYGRRDAPRTGYVNPADVTGVLPIPAEELDAILDDPPDWYPQD
jgi:hypothetical protein